ncbi:polysaccharide deacetylase family protein [Halobellus sp. Atlit-38R]|uniref:polysaccharide deacetylase family protein n=1 Tax=Halobellus sp. Atlit-38R TaxID=2282131 RepID=UPI0011C3C12F|nr:polysaccharide deacetylase family protein [Halobellus sp. Atlit-38R]
MNETSYQFIWKEYRSLLERLVSAGYDFNSFTEDPQEGCVYLRHDVDWSPEKALEMARIESDYGVSSTYFFLLTSPLYNSLFDNSRDIISRIVELGHNIGLHFSTHQYWPKEPSERKLRANVKNELSILSNLSDEVSPVISFHVPPAWVLDTTFDSLKHTYEPMFFSEIEYVADSNHRWRTQPPFANGLPKTMQILTHPGLWDDSPGSFEERLREAQEIRFNSTQTFLKEQFLDH